MDVREKLVELLNEFYGCDPMYYNVDALAIADHLASNGVTRRMIMTNCKDCTTNCVYRGKDNEARCGSFVGTVTNADRIRAMSDEELAVFFDRFSGRCLDCAENAKNKSCPIYKEGCYCRPQDIMEWLQQPAEGD